jgi:hypothetical protein
MCEKIGVIDPRMDPAAVCRDAVANAEFLCDQTYGTSPAVDIKGERFVFVSCF